MRKYSIEILQTVQKFITNLDKKTRNKILEEILDLENNPRPYGSVKLKGYDGFRIRVGDYRIVYEIKDNILLVTIVKVGHRKDVYE